MGGHQGMGCGRVEVGLRVGAGLDKIFKTRGLGIV